MQNIFKSYKFVKKKVMPKVDIELDELYALKKELEESNLFIIEHLSNRIRVDLVASRLRNLKRYRLTTNGSDDLGFWAVGEEEDDGDWIKFEDIENIIKEINK